MIGRAAGLCLAVMLTAQPADARRRGRAGSLSIESTVMGATVLVDGKVVGKSPVSVQVTPGSHSVVVRHLGHLEFSERVQVRAGDTETVIADLLPFAGAVKVTATAPRAKVLVDGLVVGETPLEREVDVGSHTIEVRAPDQPAYIEKITAGAGSVHTIHVNFAGGKDAAADDLELALVPLSSAAADPDAEDDPMMLAPLVIDTSPAKPSPMASPLREIAAVDPTALPPLGKPGVAATATGDTPFYKTWWFWTGVGVVAAAGGAYAVTNLVGKPATEPELPIFYPGDSCVNCGSLGD